MRAQAGTPHGPVTTLTADFSGEWTLDWLNFFFFVSLCHAAAAGHVFLPTALLDITQ